MCVRSVGRRGHSRGPARLEPLTGLGRDGRGGHGPPRSGPSLGGGRSGTAGSPGAPPRPFPLRPAGCSIDWVGGFCPAADEPWVRQRQLTRWRGVHRTDRLPGGGPLAVPPGAGPCRPATGADGPFRCSPAVRAASAGCSARAPQVGPRAGSAGCAVCVGASGAGDCRQPSERSGRPSSSWRASLGGRFFFSARRGSPRRGPRRRR